MLRSPKFSVTKHGNQKYPKKKKKTSGVQSSSSKRQQNIKTCLICLDDKPASQMFQRKTCAHPPMYCRECIGLYIAAKIGENRLSVRCPGVGCEDVLEPHYCRSVVPEEVLDRWSNTFECPHEDCGAELVVGKFVNKFKCYRCRRFLCAGCKGSLSWLGGIDGGRLTNKQNDIRLRVVAWTMNWRRCPGCQIYLGRACRCRYTTCRSTN